MNISPSEKYSTIQYGYRKCGTHAPVFSRTLTNGNSKIEIRQRNKERRRVEKSEMKLRRMGTKEKESLGIVKPQSSG